MPALPDNAAVTTDDPEYVYLTAWENTLERFRTEIQPSAFPEITRLRDYLTAFPAEQQEAMLVNLVAEHLQQGWRSGRGQRLEAYIVEFGDSFASFASLAALPLDLIEEEFLARHSATCSKAPSLDEYRRRFPSRADVHEALAARCLDQERYVLLRRLAEGGLGRVWVAYDRHLGRQVAVKEPRPECGDDPRVARRLADEARVTAGLEHPAIVSVHEYRPEATHGPFYVMRLVRGRTLREVICDYHQKPVAKQGVLWNRLLAAFATVCDAVAYAHAQGVIHRDLKPQNIVLGDFGETVVLDWGLAKRLSELPAKPPAASPRLAVSAAEATTPTSPSSPAGTLLYMAPEQLLGQTGEHSDIFSLGAILYEILTGQGPYEAEDLQKPQKLWQRVREVRYLPPRSVRPDVARPLEAICLKALAVDPARRYATAAELAEEIRRYQADEPVHAHREPLTARVGRWARRHRSVVVGSGVLLLATVWFLTALVVVQDQNRRRLETEQARTEEQRQRAETNFREAQAELSRWFAQIKEDPGYKQGLVPEHLRREVLKAEAALYQKFVQLQADSPELQTERGRAFWRLAIASAELQAYDEARDAYQSAIATFTALAQAAPTKLDYRADVGACRSNFAAILQALGKVTEAEQTYRAAIGDLQTLTAATATPRYAVELARACHNLGTLLRDTGRPGAAEEMLLASVQGMETALARQETLDPRHGQLQKYRADLAATRTALGQVYAQTGRFPQAEQADLAAVELLRSLVRDYPAQPRYRADLAAVYQVLGSLYVDAPTLANSPALAQQRAEEAYRSAVALREVLVREHPALPDYRNRLAKTYNSLANLLCDTNRSEEGRIAYLQAQTILEALVKDDPGHRSDLANVYNNLAVQLANHKQFGKAKEAFERARSIQQALVREQPDGTAQRVQLGSTLGNLGQLAASTGDPAAALVSYSEAITVLQAVLAREPRHATGCHYLRLALRGRVRLHTAQARHADALADWDLLLARVQPGSPDARERGSLRLQRVRTLIQLGRHEAARAELADLSAGIPW